MEQQFFLGFACTRCTATRKPPSCVSQVRNIHAIRYSVSNPASRMVRTGDWGISDLIRYLVAVESSLTATELDRLRQTVAFTKEEDNQQNGITQQVQQPTRWRAMDLYEPSTVLRELGLPIISWGTSPKWRSSSDEGLDRPYSSVEMLSEVHNFSQVFVQVRTSTISSVKRSIVTSCWSKSCSTTGILELPN